MILIFFLLVQEGGSESPPDTSYTDTVSIIRYKARTILYDLENSRITLRDSSRITYQDIILLSDSAYYHVDLNHLEAFGCCDLRQQDDSIKGTYLRYNIESKKALMIDGTTQIEKGYIDGKRIFWIDDKTVNAYSGTYTTCSDSPPHYYFYSPKMKVYLGDMVIARPIVLYIEGFPVIAAPFWFVPISSKRKSGLLPFRAGNSSSLGKYIRGFAYYLVVSDYMDMTFQVDAMEKKGIRPHIETIWDYAPFSKGAVYGSYIRETDTKIERYNIKARNSSEHFLFGSSFNFDINYLSDNTYDQDYVDTTVLWLETEISSHATLTRDIAGFRNSVALERTQVLSSDSIAEKMPFYTFTAPSRTFFSLVSYQFTGHFNRARTLTSQTTREVTGANINTNPSMKYNVLNLFTVSPQLTCDYALFNEDTAGNTWPGRFGYSFGLTARTNLYRVFDVELLGVHGILHKILPTISYGYTPDFQYGHLPFVSGILQFGRQNSFSFGVSQIIEGKIGEENKKTKFTQVNINSGYSLITDSLTPISATVELPYNPFPQPVNQFTSRVSGSIDPYTKEYTYTIMNTTGLKFDFFSININQSYLRDGMYQIWFNGTLDPTRNWSIAYSARYDWQQKKVVDYSFSLKRNLHCWEAAFSFDQLGDIWRYDFKIYIKDIPDVQIGKGLLGYILE
jgi:lipopolysaccharide assembly outer membrane protein LptD (OstA)